MKVNINVQGLNDVQQALHTLKNKAKDTTPLMAELSNHLYNVVEKSFENQTSPAGESWSPIKQALRQKKDGSTKILYKTGDMQNSLSTEHSSTKAAIGLNAISNGYPYPLVHQFGTIDGKIQARPFMPIKNDGSIYENTSKEIVEIIEDYINDSVK